MIAAVPTWAQRRGGQPRGWYESEPMEHRFEIIPYAGYAWTISEDVFIPPSISGKVDIKSGFAWGVAVDVNVRPGAQVELLYHRQDSELELKRAGGTKEDLGDIAVEYWHVGGTYGVRRDMVMPYSSVSLGGTRFDGPGGDEWKFSMMLGLGAKVYASERIGLRLGARLPISFTSGGVGIGTGGVSFGGTGITQFDVIGGLVIML